MEPERPNPDNRMLTIDLASFRERTLKLFRELKANKEFEQEFIHNPTTLLSEKLLGRPISRQKASDTNRLLFSMMANRKFRDWLSSYEPGKAGNVDAQFRRDFAKAVVEYGDPTIVGSLFEYVANTGALPFIGGGDAAEQFVCGPKQSSATPAATPSTSDQTAHSSSNANIQFGSPDAVDPVVMRSVTAQIIAYASELARTGALDNYNAPIL
jgi:hypothetical protein